MKKIITYKNKNKLCSRCLGEVGSERKKDLEKSIKSNKQDKEKVHKEDLNQMKEDLKGFSEKIGEKMRKNNQKVLG